MAGSSRRGRSWLWPVLTAVVLAVTVLGYNAWRIEVVVGSDPSGAVVSVDGRRSGVTPLTLALAPGRHRVELNHSRYQPAVLDLDVDHGDRVHRQVVLDTGTGHLSLLSNPRGAWVEIDGKRQDGVTPMTIDVAAGPVTVRMGLDERRPREQKVIVRPDKTLEVNLALNIDPHGSLTVVVAPEDARIRLPELDVGYEPGVRIPIGEQLVEVSRRGYETQQIRYDVRYGDNFTRVTLHRAFGTIRVRTSPADAEVRLTYESEPGRQTTVAYQQGMQLPLGPVDVSARSLGHRSAHRSVTVDRDGVSLDLTLPAMSVTPGETFRDPLRGGGEGPLMVVIPPGRFVMGEPGGPPSVTPATVRWLSQPFATSVDEISVAEYRRFADATGTAMPDGPTEAQQPMHEVSWGDAVAYAEWLSGATGRRYRLPTEAEWEYVARAGTDTAYWFGDDPAALCRFANLADQSAHQVFREWAVAPCDDGFARIAPLGSYPPNPFGVRAILGNLAEWVQECGMPSYDGAPEDGTVVNGGQSCDNHGIRGGAWDSQPEALRASRRGFARDRGDDRGIRLIKEL